APVEGWIQLDALDGPAGDGGADGTAVQHARDLEVVDIERAAGELVVPFEPGHALADRAGAEEDLGRPRSACPGSWAAARTPRGGVAAWRWRSASGRPLRPRISDATGAREAGAA